VTNHLDRNIVSRTPLRGLVDGPIRTTTYLPMYVVMLQKIVLSTVPVFMQMRWECHGWRHRFTAFARRLEMRAECTG
jgi:hypothetical protein